MYLNFCYARGVCNFLGSVSSQQKFEMTDRPELQPHVISSDRPVLQLCVTAQFYLESKGKYILEAESAAATAAKLLQSCPTLCDPIDSSPPGSPRPWDSPGKNTGVGCHCLLQCMKVKSLSHVRLSLTPWTATHQGPPSMGFSRQEYWSGLPLPSPWGWGWVNPKDVKRSPWPNFDSSFYMFFLLHLSLPYVNWRRAICFTWGSHSDPWTCLCSIFMGFSLLCLLATTILDSFFLF